MINRFFVTIWLKKEDTDSDIKLISKQLQEISHLEGISIVDDLKISSGKSRLTVRGSIDARKPESVLAMYADRISSETGRTAKGRLLE